MSEHTAEFQYSLLCSLLVEGSEGIDVVEGVEQEMGIDLIPQNSSALHPVLPSLLPDVPFLTTAI